mmetsp:Transcript_7066/g.8766  ORF Transcript_7066/g.8766 Transcript_7066/m.8766 type:complete len:101 (-) Transcript_7066:139-441(-)
MYKFVANKNFHIFPHHNYLLFNRSMFITFLLRLTILLIRKICNELSPTPSAANHIRMKLPCKRQIISKHVSAVSKDYSSVNIFHFPRFWIPHKCSGRGTS